MSREVSEQLAKQASSMSERANALSQPIAMEELSNSNGADKQIESVSFPNINERTALLAKKLLEALNDGFFIKKREGNSLQGAVETLIREFDKNPDLNLKIDKTDNDQVWSAECTTQLIPAKDYREGVSLPLQKFVFNKLLEVFSGQKNVLEIDVLDLPAINLYHLRESSSEDFYQATGASFLEYASLRNLFALLETIASYAKNSDFKIKVNLEVEDISSTSFFGSGIESYQLQNKYLNQLKNWQAQIFANYPELTDVAEINWTSEENNLKENNISQEAFEQKIGEYKSAIRKFWLYSERVFQTKLKELNLSHWSEIKSALKIRGVDEDKAKDSDVSFSYRALVAGLLKDLESEAFFKELPGKDSFLQMMTPIEKERLLRQAASVFGKENLNYQQLFFDDELMNNVCDFLAKKIYFSELKADQENITFVFGKQLVERDDPRNAIVLKPLGNLSKLPADKSLANNRADFYLEGGEQLRVQAKKTTETVITEATLNLKSGEGVPVFLRLSYDDLSAESPNYSFDEQKLNELIE